MSKLQAVEVRKRRRPGAPGGTAPGVRRVRSPWRLVRGGAVLHRVYEFPNAASAASFSQFAINIASHTKLPLFVHLAGLQVTLALRGTGSRQLGPLTSKLFDDLASLS